MNEPEPSTVSEAEDAEPAALTVRRSVWERIYLTYQYHGLRSLAYRFFTFPLRFTPLRSRLRFVPRAGERERKAALEWYADHGRPVTVVIPSYRDADDIAALVRSVHATVDPTMVEIIVADDASGGDHLERLRRIPGILVIAGEENRGFAANVNRGLRVSDPTHDVVVLNSDMIARPGWLESLQYAASEVGDIGIVGAKLLYPDGRIQFGGTVRNQQAPEWFDHRFRFRAADFAPANVAGPALAVTGACMYLTRELIDRLGELDEAFPMAYEDVDLCLRAWQAGLEVWYWPAAVLEHHESTSRGTIVGDRERHSQEVFWNRWSEFFDARDVRTPDGALRIVYVTEDTGVGGGHRDIFEHLNRLAARGHDAELWTLGTTPDWFALEVPVRSFADYEDLHRALAPVRAIKVATWWNTSRAVWLASLNHGIGVYFVQDIESSYYEGSPAMQVAVHASYQPEFRYMTISSWNRDRLRELGLDATLIPPGIDLATFRPRPEVTRREDMVLALGRSNPLKNFPLTRSAWRELRQPRPELCLFGIEPRLAAEPGMRYVTAPSDAGVSELFNQATVFVQTSVHEGFCLPPLEAMATGGAVVCTDAHGNRDFCRDGVNCLMPAPRAGDVSAAITRLLDDPGLRRQLGAAGLETAADYAWNRRIDALEAFLLDLAEPRRLPATTDVVPGLRRAPAS